MNLDSILLINMSDNNIVQKSKSILLILIIILFSFNIVLAQSTSTDPITNPSGSTGNGTSNTVGSSTEQIIQIPEGQESQIKKDDSGKVISADLTIKDEKSSELILGGKKFYAPKGSQVIINENEKDLIQIRVPKDSKIEKDPEINNTADNKQIKYISLEGDLTLPNGRKFSGTIMHDGKNYYLNKGNEAIIDKVKIKNIESLAKNVNPRINIYFKEENFEGNYVYFGEKVFKTGSLNSMDGNPVEFLPGNKYINVDENSHLSVVPFSKSEIVLEDGKLSMKGKGIMDNDYSSYLLSGDNGKLFYKKGISIPGFNSQDYTGKNQVNLELLPFKSDGNPISNKNEKLTLYGKNNAKITIMTSEESRVFINPENQEIPVKPTNENVQITPGSTGETLPDFSKYAGPETTARSKNFYVISQSGNAKMYAAALENARYKNAMDWMGKPLPDWNKPVVVKINENPNMPDSGGATALDFNPLGGKPLGYSMSVVGPRNSLLYSTIPHEVMHIVTAENFGKPIPMFITEGISTTAETVKDKAKHMNMLSEFLKQGRWYDFDTLSRMQDYPKDYMPLYAEGHSITEYLIQQGGGGTEGRKKLFAAISYANNHGWNAAMKQYYGANSLSDIQKKWLQSISSKIITIFVKILLAISFIIFIKKKNFNSPIKNGK
jgi:hypothetical protein